MGIKRVCSPGPSASLLHGARLYQSETKTMSAKQDITIALLELIDGVSPRYPGDTVSRELKAKAFAAIGTLAGEIASPRLDRDEMVQILRGCANEIED